MITLLEDLPQGTLGLSFSGEVTGDDDDRVLVPAIEAALDQHGRIKALLVFGPEFQGYTLAAAWDDTSLGLRHWDGFERLAVATDVPWLRQSFRAIGLVLPYPVRLFNGEEVDQARRWLAESLGTIHLDQHDGVVTIAMIGRLDPEAYRRIDDDLANVFSHHTPVRLLLDLRQFDGWLGLNALSQHLALLREYRTLPQLVAVIGAQRWQHAAQRLLGRFVNARTRYFDSDHVGEAQQWLAAA
ncbi:MAG: STAS/SEC14 domain-containing protein [Cyanobacteriota bacterium]|nr:STAS/SEC14 domain-containing protein [Cyanobacteriota bacterium]